MPTKLTNQPLLIVGLGNPGSAYKLTRHNLGFLAIEAIAKKRQVDWIKKPNLSAELAWFKIDSRTVRLIKPLTYMNLSGQAVKKTADYFKIDRHNIWLINDDLDLPLGTIRLSKQSRSGGHNGVQSIFDYLNGPLDWRWRLGIGRPPPPLATEDYVLQKFSASEKPLALKTADVTADLIIKSVNQNSLTSQTIIVN